MLRIAMEDFSPRVSLEGSRRSFGLPFPSLKMMDSLPRNSFNYNKLPVEPITLSVLKLDGSSFDVQVMRTATVGDLKLAVEAVFSHMPRKGPGKISWSHVWGHFCLCYNGQKLVTETDCIGSYGIKDGDQLYFTRHVSCNRILAKGQSKKSKQQKLSESEPKNCEENVQKVETIDFVEDVEKGEFHNFEDDDMEVVGQSGCGVFPSFFRGWFFYSTLPNAEGANNRGKSLAADTSSTHGCGFFMGLRELLGMSTRKGYYSQRDTWRED